MTRRVPIYGTNPFGVPNRLYALYCPDGEQDLYFKRAEEAGWTNLMAGSAQPELWTDDLNTDESASSASPTSPTSKRRHSRTSASA